MGLNPFWLKSLKPLRKVAFQFHFQLEVERNSWKLKASANKKVEGWKWVFQPSTFVERGWNRNTSKCFFRSTFNLLFQLFKLKDKSFIRTPACMCNIWSVSLCVCTYLLQCVMKVWILFSGGLDRCVCVVVASSFSLQFPSIRVRFTDRAEILVFQMCRWPGTPQEQKSILLISIYEIGTEDWYTVCFASCQDAYSPVPNCRGPVGTRGSGDIQGISISEFTWSY